MSSLQGRAALFATGAACGAVSLALLRRWASRRAAASAAQARRISGKDFRGAPSAYLRSKEGVVGLLAYDVCEPLSEEEYDKWLFDVHYHDLLANPHLDEIVLHTVDKVNKARLSSGAAVENKVGFFRLAELRFRDLSAYNSYVEWFQANTIPQERTPAGKSAFTFYHLGDTERIARAADGGGCIPALRPAPAAVAAAAGGSAVISGPIASQRRGSASGAAIVPKAPTTVLVVGSTGNLGGAVIKRLREHEGVTVVEASRGGQGGAGSVQLDIANAASVKALDTALPGGVDHVVVCCGASTFGPLASFDEGKWEANVSGKLLAVSRLVVMLANGKDVRCLRDGGSITVTTGQSAKTVNRTWPGLATNNAGLEAFVRCAGLDAPRGVRVNAVSPALVRETAVKAGLPLEGTVPAAEAAAEYLPLIFGDASGEVVEAGSQTVFVKSHQTEGKANGKAS